MPRGYAIPQLVPVSDPELDDLQGYQYQDNTEYLSSNVNAYYEVISQTLHTRVQTVTCSSSFMLISIHQNVAGQHTSTAQIVQLAMVLVLPV